MTAHIIQPVSQVETEEAQGNEGQEDDFIPYAGEPVSVLTQPVENTQMRKPAIPPMM